MEIKVNLTLKEIYQVLCPNCQEKLLELSAKSANIDALKGNLKNQFEDKGNGSGG